MKIIKFLISFLAAIFMGASQIAAEDELAVVSPYFLVHQYMSVIAPEIDVENGYILGTPEFLNSYCPSNNGFASPFKDEDIEVTVIDDDGRDIYIWRFPEPKHLREAFYVAFVPIDGHYVAYAISIGQLVDWEISTSSEKSRSTFGRVKKPESAMECWQLLRDRGALTGEITPGEFIQEGYECPPYAEAKKKAKD